VFSLEGADLKVTVPVTFAEAALGAAIDVPTLDGGTVKLKVTPGIPSGRVLRVKGRGAVTKARTGDLLVTVQIVVPQRLDDSAREAVEAFARATADQDVRAELFARHQGAGDVR
jgi:molecular chaperone DnaJ